MAHVACGAAPYSVVRYDWVRVSHSDARFNYGMWVQSWRYSWIWWNKNSVLTGTVAGPTMEGPPRSQAGPQAG